MNPTPPRAHLLCPILAAALTAALTAACARGPQSASFTPTESSLYITSEGTITSATIETYTNDYYTEEELKSSVEEALTAFNAAQPSSGDKKAAAINACTLSNGTAALLIDFKDPSAYLAFMAEYPDEESKIQIKAIQITDAASCSYADVSFSSPDGKKETSAEELKTQTKLYTAAIEGPALLQTDGAIQYISDGVTLVGENQVRTPADGISYVVFK